MDSLSPSYSFWKSKKERKGRKICKGRKKLLAQVTRQWAPAQPTQAGTGRATALPTPCELGRCQKSFLGAAGMLIAVSLFGGGGVLLSVVLFCDSLFW